MRKTKKKKEKKGLGEKHQQPSYQAKRKPSKDQLLGAVSLGAKLANRLLGSVSKRSVGEGQETRKGGVRNGRELISCSDIGRYIATQDNVSHPPSTYLHFYICLPSLPHFLLFYLLFVIFPFLFAVSLPLYNFLFLVGEQRPPHRPHRPCVGGTKTNLLCLLHHAFLVHFFH